MLDSTHLQSVAPREEAEQEKSGFQLAAVGQLTPGPLEDERRQDQDDVPLAAVGQFTPSRLKDEHLDDTRLAAVGLLTTGPLEDDNEQCADVADAELTPELSGVK